MNGQDETATWNWWPFSELSDAHIVVARIEENQSALSDEEYSSIASAVPARVREFTAGRTLARVALSRLDVHPKSIPVGSGGQPVWPETITGSISHTATHAGVAVASQYLYRGVGFDIEVAGSADQLDQVLILTPREMDRMHNSPPADYVTKVFSCKEAVFKAVFPIAGEFFEFCDVEISLAGSNFQAAMKKSSRSARVLASGCGSVIARDGLVATVFCVR